MVKPRQEPAADAGVWPAFSIGSVRTIGYAGA
jgi:hypothetical protein